MKSDIKFGIEWTDKSILWKVVFSLEYRSFVHFVDDLNNLVSDEQNEQGSWPYSPVLIASSSVGWTVVIGDSRLKSGSENYTFTSAEEVWEHSRDDKPGRWAALVSGVGVAGAGVVVSV